MLASTLVRNLRYLTQVQSTATFTLSAESTGYLRMGSLRSSIPTSRPPSGAGVMSAL